MPNSETKRPSITNGLCDWCELPMPHGCSNFSARSKECPLEPRADLPWLVGFAIWEDLTDRRGVKHELLQCAPAIQVEIVEAMGNIAIKAGERCREVTTRKADGQNVKRARTRRALMPSNDLLEEMLVGWPNCTTPDCENKQCTWSDTPYCFPCAERRIGRAELILRFDATHDMTWEETKRIEALEDAETVNAWEEDDDAE